MSLSFYIKSIEKYENYMSISLSPILMDLTAFPVDTNSSTGTVSHRPSRFSRREVPLRSRREEDGAALNEEEQGRALLTPLTLLPLSHLADMYR
uniref:Uncharacterized protein n=1 Tax=Knipowitschia caucasica TaxID=637954 RepID=A0AAV2K6S8_KNICA